MHNGIKKLFLTSLFVIFGLCFNSSFATVQTVEKGEELVPSAGGYNTTYTQGINEDGSFYLSNGTIEKNGLAFNYIYNYSSSHYPGFQFWGEYETGYALFQFAENRAGNSSIYTEFRVYPYISMVPNKQPTLNCSATKPDNFTGNVCYYKDINDLGEEYNGKFSGLYFDNNRQLISCFIFEDMNEVFCPGNPVKTGNNNTVQWTGNAIAFTNFDESLVKYPVFIAQEQPTTPEPATRGQCPTINQLIASYPSDYNTGLCYSASRLLTSTGIVNTTKQSIFELFPTYQDRKEGYITYLNYCTKTTSTEVCRQAFEGQEAEWSLFNKVPGDNILGLYQYCHLQLNIEDKNATTCVLSTGAYYASGVTEQEFIDELQGDKSALDLIVESVQNISEIPTINTGYVFDELLEEGDTREGIIKLDIFKTFLKLRSKLTTLFYFRTQYDGILPVYLSSFIIIIILFKIIKK